MSAAELRSVAELLLGRWRAGVGDADPEHCALVPIEDLERLALALGRRSGGQDWPQPWPVEVRRLMTWLRSVADKGAMYGDGRPLAPDVDALERFLRGAEPEGMEQPQPWPARSKRFFGWLHCVADPTAEWEYEDGRPMASDAQEFLRVLSAVESERSVLLLERDEALRELDQFKNRLCCAYCGMEVEKSSDSEAQRDAVVAHFGECKKAPYLRMAEQIVRLEQERDVLSATLNAATVKGACDDPYGFEECAHGAVRECGEAATKSEAALIRLGRLEDAAKAVLADVPATVCRSFHHADAERYHCFGRCPPQERFRSAIDALRDALSQPTPEAGP